MKTGSPLKGHLLIQLQDFLQANGLHYDPSIDYTALLMEDDQIAAAGSLDGGTIKCVAVSPAHQGEDLTGRIMTELLQEAARRGRTHLMLYTKPRNQMMFTALGFHPIIRTADCLLMENRSRGLDDYLHGLSRPEKADGPIGCIVANADPFTRGHRYLAERAAAECAWVHLFILSEERGMFSARTRLQMAQDACADLPNVLVHPTGPYMVSSATFPSYFLKDKEQAAAVHCEVDIRLFGEKIAPALGITRRYVGTEPRCPVTAAYNERMKQLLPGCGVALVEVPRVEAEGGAVSASRAREMLRQGKNDLSALLPESTIKLI